MRDWKKVNNNLVKRGMLWVDFSFLKQWKDEVKELNHGKVGRKYIYPNSLFYLTAFIACFIPFRQAEGFLLALSKIKPFKVPDYTTIFRRVRKLKFSLNVNKLKDGFIVAIDSTGIKVTNRGEWLRKIHGKKYKGWLKIHVAIDVKEKRLIGLSITDERVGDNSEFNNLLSQILKAGKPYKLLADSAYDSRDNFNILANLGIEPGIKPRKVEIMPEEWVSLKRKKPRVKAKGSIIRKKHVIEYTLDPEKWKEKVNYGKRWGLRYFSQVLSVYLENM